MSFHRAASRPFSSQRATRTALFASVSMLSLVAVPASARNFQQGGGTANSAVQAASTAALASAAQAAASSQQARQSLVRAAQTLRAMQAAQAAARSAAQAAPGGVPNGLIVGGLEPDSGLAAPGTANGVSTWVNANTPTQSRADGQTTVTIQQTGAKAILNWKSFHVGKDTIVNFDQSGGADPGGNSWIALNRVTDPTGVPSQILGQIRADGAVYIVNKNGIVFGGASQINVGTLLASTLNITVDQFNNGILYQASGVANSVAEAFTGTPGQTAALSVQAGAIINAASGGKVLLLGGNVTNAGTILTPQGQSILASGDKVYLEQNATLDRGIVANVESGLVGSYDTVKRAFVHTGAGSGWTARNDGLISADLGNITLVGQNVTQNGVVTATTSAAFDGSIRLWARTDQYQSISTSGGVQTINGAYRGMFGGILTLGPGSLTQVRADLTSSDFVLGSDTFKTSSIDLVGKTVTIGANSTILGEAAKVSILAADMTVIAPLLPSSGSTTYNEKPDDGSRIYFDTGSLIDVSGVQNVPLAMERNSVAAELRGDEFADLPQLRDGPLRGKTIYVDRRVSGVNSDGTTWVGTRYGNVSGWLGLLPYQAGELMSNGGSVRIESRGDVITRGGSQIIAVGGSLSYASGHIRTSKILWNNHLYDISQATPDMVGAVLFDGGFTVDHARWGVTEVYNSIFSRQSHFERGYRQGQSGGQVLVTARHAVLDGNIDVSAGYGDPVHGNANVAIGGKLSIGEAVSGIYERVLPEVVVGTPSSVLKADFGKDSLLSSDRASTIYLRPDLINDSGAKDVAINTNQTFTLNADARIVLVPGGSFNVLAATAVINGTIRAPNGDVTIQARVAGAQQANTLAPKIAKTITVGADAVIDVSGLWINLSEGDNARTLNFSKSWVNGGNVTLSAERTLDSSNAATGDGALNVAAGSLIDVSSGGLVLANGKLAGTSDGTPLGNAGTISLIGNAIEKIQTGPGLVIPLPKVVASVFAGELRGYGLGTGGSLAIAAATVQIGGDPSLTASELYLDPSFFQSGGFSNYRIIGWNGVTVAPGAIVEPKVKSFLPVNVALNRLATGSRLSDALSIGFKADELRAPTSLALYAPNYGATSLTTANSVPSGADIYHVGDRGVAGDIILGAGSVIRTDPGATVDIRAARELAVFGTIEARGGTIRLANDQESGIALDTVGPDNANSAIYHRPNVTLWIDASARLIAGGVVRSYQNSPISQPINRVFDGGSVSLTGGNIVVQPGSVIDVSGATGTFVPSIKGSFLWASHPQQLATAAGQITLTPGNYLYFDPTLLVQPGDPSLRGATFAINPSTSVATSLPLAFNLPIPGYVASGSTTPETAGSKIMLRDGTGRVSDVARVGDNLPVNARPQFWVFEDGLQKAGFDNLIFATQDGVVVFRSDAPVDLSARSSIQFLSRYIGGDGSVTVNVRAPYVAFGGSIKDASGTTTNGDPAESGTGSFTVNADLIDFSRTTTFGVNRAYRGTLGVTSPLLKTAAQAGFATINFNSTGDIRFNDTPPVGTTTAASLNTYGDVTFAAAELYPLTRTGAGFVINGYAVDASGTPTIKNMNSTVTVRSNGNSAQVPLSANGSLTIAAPHIVQGGVLRAPSGQITLTNATVALTANLAAPANSNMILAPGSLTSVDLDGALIPYGVTRNGTDFLFKGNAAAVPQKQITLTGTTIDVKAGAQVTASGGGDLSTYEFVAGTGGSVDVLSGRNVFAVIPSYRGALPKEPEGLATTSLTVGNSVYLSGIPGLPAGNYVLLPGHLALMPGAFRVTVSSANSDLGASTNRQTAMGGYLTAGYLTDQFSGARVSGRWSTFLVESGDVVRSRSQYNESTLSDFTANVAQLNNVVPVRLPNEPGRIQINATSVLTFEGSARTSPVAGGRGGQIDISSGGPILITGTDATPVAGTLVLRADQLSRLETESLLIGGTRSQTSADGNATVLNGASVTVAASSVTLDTQGTEFTGTEIILVALNSITAKTGSILRATGPYRSTPSPDLLLDQGTSATPTAAQKANDGAAILAVTNGARPNFQRGNGKTGVLPAIGNVTINAGVVLDGGNSLLIDGAVVNLAFGATSKLTAKAVTLGSNHISIGDLQHAQTAPLAGLQLDLGALAALSQINTMTLRSRETIDLYGAFSFGGMAGEGSSITLDSAGLVATSNSSSVVTITAGTVNLTNSNGVSAAAVPAAGTGGLVVRATDVTLAGNVFIDGVSDTRILATGAITSTSSGLFDIRKGSLTLEAGQLTSAASVSRVIQAPNGSMIVQASAGGNQTPATNAGGARLKLIARDIAQNGNVVLPGGVVVLQATAGNVSFGSGSTTDVSGFSKDFFDVTREAPAGRVDVIATGNVAVATGALLNVSSSGDAGTVTVTAGGQFDLRGTLNGQGGAGFRNGAFSLDAGTITDFDAMNAILNVAHFDRERNFRIRNGDVVIGASASIAARRFTLSTDNGAITVAGRIDASGDGPGDIRLSASGNVIVAGSAALDASGVEPDAAGHGGAVAIESANGFVDVQAGSRITVGAGGDNGVLSLRVKRNSNNNEIDANTHLRGTLSGVGAVNVEAYKVYTNTTTLASSGSGAGILTFATIDADNAQFINAAGAAIRARLAGEMQSANAGFNAGLLHLQAGAEVTSSTSLTVTNAGNVNLGDFRYGGEGGVLTLRAAGNLNINGNISDGFSTALAATGQLYSVNDAKARSWSYRLVAGADLTAGDTRQAHQAGDFVLAAGTLVRTGTGSIEVYSGRDVNFVGRASVLYTAGVARDLTGLTAATSVSPVTYGINGGDVTLVAAGNISNGSTGQSTTTKTLSPTAMSEELITAWLYRQGSLGSNGLPVAGRPTSWWIDYSQFEQGGVGALGGGNIRIKAGDPRSESSGNITNFAAVLPTSGLVNNGEMKFIGGGGDLAIEASGNINSGLFYVGKGIGDIRTSRSFGTGRTVKDTYASAATTVASLPIYPILALGDAQLNLIAGGDVVIQSIFNPTVAMQVARNADGGAANPWSSFFTYTANSAVTMTSTGGRTYVVGDNNLLYQSVGFTLNPTVANPNSPQATGALANYQYAGAPFSTSTPPTAASATLSVSSSSNPLLPYLIAPPTLKLTAFNGDVGFDGAVTLFPSARGTLEFLSAGSIRLMTPTVNATTGAAVVASLTGLAISDADPLRLPNILAPDFSMATARARLSDDPSTDYTKESDVARERLHATYLLHDGDPEPARFYALNGDISFRTGTTTTSATAIPIVSAKSVRMLASRDVLELRLLAQNVNDTDLTLIRAGRDLKFITLTSGNTGNSIDMITIAGPGTAELDAGRNIDLGNSNSGIQSIGNLRNPALSKDGATIALGAGMTDVQYLDFANTYLDPARNGGVYDDRLVAYIQRRHRGSPAPTATEAWTEFLKLGADDQSQLVREVFYVELNASADHAAHTDPRNLANYAQGFAAIERLFPTSATGAERRGDIRMAATRIATLDGGDIQLLTPAGDVILGLNQAAGQIQQGGGLQTQKAGGIFSMSYGDVMVGQAAVHTLGGGDIGMWSTTGNIDAGKGAKTRKNTVKPAFRTDMNGRTVFSPGSISTGAGIATLKALAGATPGNVWLATPQGFVDAGDAGIRVSGNLLIAATAVLNATNIQVQGTAVGVPTVAAPNIQALTSASNVAAASTKSIDQPGRETRETPSVIIVEVMGYGGAHDSDDSGQSSRGRQNPGIEQRSQDPRSAVQVVGAGQLTPQEQQLLTDEERGKLR